MILYLNAEKEKLIKAQSPFSRSPAHRNLKELRLKKHDKQVQRGRGKEYLLRNAVYTPKRSFAQGFHGGRGKAFA